MAVRAAVVIGVNQTGGLARLESAAASAEAVASWLQGEGYDVKLLTDSGAPVHAQDVKQALKELVTTPPKYEMLVMYFSGHGYWHARSDRWLFSDAPTDGSDAINLEGAMDLARYCGIETVVFISDACRAIPTTAEGQQVEGIDAIPNLGFDLPSKVDYFKATSKATSAYEAAIPTSAGGSGARESVLTKAFRLAYEEPTPDMVAQATVNGNQVSVVPNRRLERYLQPKVDELLAAVDYTLQQNLEINVPSADEVYIATAQSRAAAAPVAPPSLLPDPGRDAATELATAVGADAPLETLTEAASEAAVGRLLPLHGVVDHYESECGFTVQGPPVTRVVCTPGQNGAHAELLESGDGAATPGLFRVWDVWPAVSLVAQLGDGRSFVVPALRGYIGHVTIDDEGVTNVSYVPSSNDDRYPAYLDRQEDIDRLRAMVALSVDEGRFRVGEEDGWRLGARIRMEKAFDPSLGIYAAHAYSAAGLVDQIEDVLHHMRADLGVSVFDVVLLASHRIKKEEWPMVPFVPVLTQAWSLLRPRGFELPVLVDGLRPQLRNSLWTTFSVDAAGVLADAVERGDIV